MMPMKGGTALDSVKMLACMGACEIRLHWHMSRNIPSSNGIKSLKGCGFQTLKGNSFDANERWESIGLRKNACMHVWGHVKFD